MQIEHAFAVRLLAAEQGQVKRLGIDRKAVLAQLNNLPARFKEVGLVFEALIAFDLNGFEARLNIVGFDAKAHLLQVFNDAAHLLYQSIGGKIGV